MIPLFKDVKILEKNFDSCTYTHIPRKLNVVADKLANESINNNNYEVHTKEIENENLW